MRGTCGEAGATWLAGVHLLRDGLIEWEQCLFEQKKWLCRISGSRYVSLPRESVDKANRKKWVEREGFSRSGR
jgi:hypothetical protein